MLGAEYAAKPSEDRADGAGLLLAETVRGIAHGLHSKASLVFDIVLQPDVLRLKKVGQSIIHASEHKKE